MKTEQEYDAIFAEKNLKRLSEFKGSRQKVEIECYCGNVFSTTPHHIQTGNTRSCGCYKIQRTKETKLKDLTGKRYGRLVVIGYVKTINRKPIWLCKCDCGNTKEIRGNSLVTHSITTCGCRLKGYGGISKTFWGRIKARARIANIPLSLTIEEAWELYEKQKGKCAITGLPLYFAKFYQRETRQQTASLDRIDSKKSYTLENVQWVHKDINFMKHTLSMQNFLELCRLVTDYVK